MTEEPICYGEQGRGMAIATLPESLTGAPVVMIFNAGLLHRAEPHRINVLVARELAKIGCIVIRADWSGLGDTPARQGVTSRDSVEKDWQFLKQAAVERFGVRPLLLMGLCSGSDDAVILASQEDNVKGLILLDPVVKKDSGFMARAFFQLFFNLQRWKNIPGKITTSIAQLFASSNQVNDVNMDELRDLPTDENIKLAFDKLINNDGRVLAFFTNYALRYYNKQGQWSRVVSYENFSEICDENFWPYVDHLYTVSDHREMLIKAIADWVKDNFEVRFRYSDERRASEATSKIADEAIMRQ